MPSTARTRPLLLLFLALLSLPIKAHGSAAGIRKLNFDPDWKFLKQDLPAASSPDFDDSAWTTVSCPHTFNDVEAFSQWSPKTMRGQADQWMGRTWYRKHFKLDSTWTGKKIFIEFESVRQVADVFINGHLLGESKTGFTPFGFDLSPFVKFGDSENILSVMADNTFDKEDRFGKSSDSPIMPWNDPRWHPPLGGIYRNVYLFILDPVHLTLPLFSNLKTEGVYNYASQISKDSATVTEEAQAANESPDPQQVSCTVEFLGPTGQRALSLASTQTIPAGKISTFTLTGQITNPMLWSPDTPYLYTARTTLIVNYQPRDQIDTPLGIRSAQWSVKSGFFLNGTHIKLHGWGQRPTDEWPGLGDAFPDWMHDYTIQLMKDAGGNYIRWGHCAAGPADIRASDQMGLVVQQPGVDGESDCTGEAWRVRTAAFRDVLIYYRNNPSILLWEGGNQHVTEPHIQQLAALKNQFDPHGGRAFTFRRASPMMAKYMDVSTGTEGSHECPSLPVVEGEYDREESPRRVWDNFSPPNFGYPEAKGQSYDLTSEQYAINETTQYEKIAASSHCGGGNWVFSDTTSGGRVDCEVARDSGEVDGVRLPKEAYFACKSIFRPDAQVYLIGHWSYPPNTVKDEYVVTNCPQVSLQINGQSIGAGQRINPWLVKFSNVKFQPGAIKAVAFISGKPVATCEKQTAGPPAALKLSCITGPTGLLATGSDIALIDVQVVDAQGNRCPTVQSPVTFSLTGPAIWRGGYNSGKINTINQTTLDIEAGIQRVSLRSTESPGPITLTATVANLPPATIQITSRPIPIQSGFASELPATPAHPIVLRNTTIVNAAAPAAAIAPTVPTTNYIADFSYSGPTPGCIAHSNLQNGDPIYCDSPATFSNLPDFLQGADHILPAAADANYSALDFIQLSAKTDTDIYIAHDDSLPTPDWLTTNFKPTSTQLKIGAATLTLFQHHCAKGDSLTLGSNIDKPTQPLPAMYLVFACKPAAPALNP